MLPLRVEADRAEKRGELIDLIMRFPTLRCPKEVLEAKRVSLY
jgi:hypothetical protein